LLLLIIYVAAPAVAVICVLLILFLMMMFIGRWIWLPTDGVACFVMLGVLTLDLFAVNADATFVHY